MISRELETDRRTLVAAVRAAGPIALDLFRGTGTHWDKRPGHPVSEADLAVNRHLATALRGARPDYGWLSEESRDRPGLRTGRRTWIVDPIDGTRAFIRGRAEFSIAAALVENGRPLLGVVYSPATEEFYEAADGDGARLNGAAIRVAGRPADGARLLVSRSELQKRGWSRAFGDCTVEAISSIALKLARVAAGRAHATVSLWPKSDWDLAAGDLLVAEAGGVALGLDGAPFRYNREKPRHDGVIAAGRDFAADILQRIGTL